MGALQHALGDVEERLEELLEASVRALEKREEMPGKAAEAAREAQPLHRRPERLAETPKRRLEERVEAALEQGAVPVDPIDPILQDPVALLQVLQLPLLALVALQQRVQALAVHPDGDGR